MCYLAEPENQEEITLSKEETKSKHKIPTKPTKKETKAYKNGVITKQMNQKDIQAKIQEEVKKEAIPWRDVPQYFKDYMINELIIIMHVVRRDQA